MVNAAVVAPVVTPAPGVAFSSFDASNMVIDRVILHQVHSRTPDKKIAPPNCADTLLMLPAAGKDALQKRLTAALGSKSHGVEMSIENIDAGSFFQVAADAIHATDSELIVASKELAKMLTKAQLTTSAPPRNACCDYGDCRSKSDAICRCRESRYPRWFRGNRQ